MFICSLGELAPRAQDAQSLGMCPLSDCVPCSIPPTGPGTPACQLPLESSCPWNPSFPGHIIFFWEIHSETGMVYSFSA